MRKTFLACSLILNLVLIAGGLLFVLKRDFVKRFIPSFSTQTATTVYIESPHYLGRKDVYENLPRKESQIIFAGDSMIDFCEWSELIERPVIKRGINGDTVKGLRLRIDGMLRDKPQKLFIMVGIGDLVYGKTVDEVKTEYQELIKTIQTTSPQTQIYLHSLLPANRALRQSELPKNLENDIIEVNRFLKEKADGKNTVFLDLYPQFVDDKKQLKNEYTIDGVHLNGQGYLKWRDILRPYISADK